MKKKISLALAAILALSTTASLTACGGGKKSKANALHVDLGSLMPTENEQATVDNPEVILESKYIAQAYKKATGIEIDWSLNYGRSISSTLEDTASWYDQQISRNNCPVIGWTSLNAFQDRDYYIVLDEYLEKPNPYVKAGEPGSVRWKDMFYDYVWESNSVKNVRGEIVAIPVLLSAGSQTGIFYNADLFEEEEIDIPTTWQEFTDLMVEINDGVVGGGVRSFAPYSGYKTPGLYQWAMEFSLTPNVLKWMTETDGEFNIDYDGDGKLTSMEVLRGVKEGKFDPTKEGPARAVYEAAYSYYADCLPTGWTNYEYKTKWDAGQLAMWDNGIWQIPMEESNVARQFDYGVFLTPIADDTTDGLEEYCAETEYYDDFDDVVCPVSVAFNVMKPAVKNNPKKLEQAIDFLMYLTAEENVSAMAREKGGTKGAVKGSDYNTLIDDIGWKDQKFPVVSYSATWPTGYTSEQSSIINKSFEQWVNGSMRANEFFSSLKTAQLAGANAYISKFNIDTSDWDI